MAVNLRAMLAATFLSVAGCFCNSAIAAPEAGWWWNPAESGRGYFIESQNGIMFMAAYIYADDGRSRWLVSGGANADPYHYAGRLLEVGGGQTLFGPYVAPATQVDAGAVSVDFVDDTHGTLTWPGGVVPIERDIFGSGDAAFLPESGWYWNPAESGSGYSIEVQGPNLFFVGFMYDRAGNPVWYFSAGPMATATTYSGALQQFSNGQTLTGAYKPPGAPANVGSLDIAFTAPDAATLTFTGAVADVQSAQTKDGATRSIDINREFQGKPHPYDFPVGFAGSFTQTVEITATSGALTATITTIAKGTGIGWGNTHDHPPTPPGYQVTGELTQYTPVAGGKVAVTVDYRAAGGGATCTGHADKTFDFKDLMSSLLISNLAEYIMQIGMAGDDMKMTVPVSCKVGNVTFAEDPWTQAVPIKIISPVRFTRDDVLAGSVGPTPVTPNYKRTGTWNLKPSLNQY